MPHTELPCWTFLDSHYCTKFTSHEVQRLQGSALEERDTRTLLELDRD